MDSILTYAGNPLETEFAHDRPRLVRFCAALTSQEAAEDVAQEALLEAWRLRDRRRAETTSGAWLFGVARNVCLRWRRQRGLAAASEQPAGVLDTIDELAVETGDDDLLELQLEREQLAELLDRALALLPPLTRDVLIGHYVEEMPHAEMAGRLGLSQGAVAVRVHRGKLALRRILERPDFADAAASYGLATDTGGWQETRIWCHLCGQRHYVGRLTEGNADFTLRCEVCHVDPWAAAHGGDTGILLAGVKGFKPAFNRFMTWADDFYRGMLAERIGRCPRCDTRGKYYLTPHPDCPSIWRDVRAVYFCCPSCRDNFDIGLTPLVLWRPEGRRFWRRYPRIRTLPEREVTFQGRYAIVTTFESVTNSARYEVISAADTFDILATFGAPPVSEGE